MTKDVREKYWSRYANHYDEYTDYIVGKTLRQALIGKLRKEKNLGDVIECGCGTGFFTRAIARNASNVLATDLSDDMLDRAKVNLKRFRNIRYKKIDCQDILFPPESFDTVLMANVIHTIPDPHKAIHESYKILRKEGRLLIVTYTDFGLDFFQKSVLAMKFLGRFGMPPPHGLKNYAPDELERFIQAAGYRVEEMELIGDRPKGLYLRSRK
jgi:ubiquinone/menaquinone biosynthesis C-methylase UbiE